MGVLGAVREACWALLEPSGRRLRRSWSHRARVLGALAAFSRYAVVRGFPWYSLTFRVPKADVEVQRAYVELRRAYVGLHEACVELHSAHVELHKAYAELHKAYVELHKAYVTPCRGTQDARKLPEPTRTKSPQGPKTV